VPVRREDQDKINRFSRLTQRESSLKEQLSLKAVSVLGQGPSVMSRLGRPVRADNPQKEKEELDDLSTELELADEDDPVP